MFEIATKFFLTISTATALEGLPCTNIMKVR